MLAAAVPPQRGPKLKLTAKERLIALFVVYEPQSLPKVEPMLREFKGRERDLFRALGRRFGISTVEALSVGGLWFLTVSVLRSLAVMQRSRFADLFRTLRPRRPPWLLSSFALRCSRSADV